MPFQPGNKHGKGNKGAKLIEEAIRRAIAQEDGKRIREGVEKLLDQFAAGELPAFHAIADRVDGRPNQQVEMNVTRDVVQYSREELIERIEALRRRIAADAGATAAGTGASEPSQLH